MVMGVSDSLPRGNRGRLRPAAQRRKVRRSRLRRMGLEGLEPRTLLATIPAAAATGAPVNLSSLMGNAGGLTTSENSTTVEVNPTNPSKIVAVWIDNDPSMEPPYDLQTILEGAYTINAGQTWTPLFGEPGSGLPVNPILADPNTDMPVLPYLQVTNPSVGFDRSENFYILDSYHNSGGTSGAIVLQKFNFSGDAPLRIPSRHRKRVVMLPIGFSTNGCRRTTLRPIRRWR